jgi:hypothetical protein
MQKLVEIIKADEWPAWIIGTGGFASISMIEISQTAQTISAVCAALIGLVGLYRTVFKKNKPNKT